MRVAAGLLVVPLETPIRCDPFTMLKSPEDLKSASHAPEPPDLIEPY